MPNQPKTPLRAMRIPDELWQAALARAGEEGTTVTAEVQAFLRRWTAEVGTEADTGRRAA